MKKTIALLFLLLANLFLLAHNIAPHHHHGEMVTCFDTHRNDLNEACNHEHHDIQTQQHEHEENSSSDKCCNIDNSYFPTENKINISCEIHTKCDCVQAFILTSYTLNMQDFIDDTIIHFRQNPYVPIFHSDFISQSLGLRAPPFFN